MVVRTKMAADNFDRADGPVGSDWLYVRPLSWQSNTPVVISNQVTGNTSDVNYQVIRYNKAGYIFSNNQYAKIILNGFGYHGGGVLGGVVLRASTGIDTDADYYAVFTTDSAPNGNPKPTDTVKMVNGVSTILNTTGVPWATGDVLSVEIEDVGGVPEISVYRNEVFQYKVSDTGTPLSGGHPGIAITGIISGDNWEGGDVGVPVNIGPTFPGPNIADFNATQVVQLQPITVSGSFSDTDTLTYSTVGAWPDGISVTTAGVIVGTPNVYGTFANLRVRATDTGGSTVDSNAFTITVAKQNVFITDPLINNTGSILANQSVLSTWFPAGRFGHMSGIVPVDGVGMTDATGKLVITGQPLGPGVLMITIPGADATNDAVYYQAGAFI